MENPTSVGTNIKMRSDIFKATIFLKKEYEIHKEKKILFRAFKKYLPVGADQLVPGYFI